ncbi:uncharacterized protein LOC117174563 [Belonocnema kinseyi]|uniref:uncharacterized protein LOC117174563 n=1 Tax=Belonocnema kinseyi TaxID=2817044 RepID=UPI00143DE9E4|nr:uncharacterized protein LOC117174563 [Belonocnema kinseyi]
MDDVEEEIVFVNMESVLSHDTNISENVLRNVHQVMGELAEDIGTKSSDPLYSKSDNEDDNYFVDAVDNNDRIINLEEENTVDKEHVVNALSYTASFQLFALINCIIETPILPNTKYLIHKLFYPKKWA